MHVVLLSADLTVVSRVQGAAARTGAVVRAATDAAAAVRLHGDAPAEVVILDLSTSLQALDAFVSQLKSNTNQPRIIAFGPHVHEERLVAARAAGCDAVISRGQFFSQVDSLLTS